MKYKVAKIFVGYETLFKLLDLPEGTIITAVKDSHSDQFEVILSHDDFPLVEIESEITVCKPIYSIFKDRMGHRVAKFKSWNIQKK